MNRRAFLAMCLAPATASAHSFRRETITIGHAWALPAEHVDGQAFFPLLNTGKDPDRLIAARSSICASIEFRHNNRYDDPAEPAFELPPMKPLPMRPTARHLRLIGMRQALVLGQVFAMILDFETAGEIEINLFVEAAGGH
jgi:periplasmic copper chaperone A